MAIDSSSVYRLFSKSISSNIFLYMDFNQCALIFEKYPNDSQWLRFFAYYRPFWQYITENAVHLFPINMVYPSSVDSKWNQADFFEANAKSTLEDFFALYFLLINYRHNGTMDCANFFLDQDLWKSLWDRELWGKRVTEENLVRTLTTLKLKLNSIASMPINTDDVVSSVSIGL